MGFGPAVYPWWVVGQIEDFDIVVLIYVDKAEPDLVVR